MIETLIPDGVEPLPYLAIAALVTLVGLARIHASDRWWCPEMGWLWNPLRLIVWPLFDKALTSVPFAFAKTTVYPDEVVNDRPWTLTLDEVREWLCDAGYEAQPLSSVASYSETGERERGSFARYYGPKPVGAPEWMRRYQVHVRPFGPDGAITLTAHAELNPWRPDLALPHLLAIGFDAEAGVEKVGEDLKLD